LRDDHFTVDEDEADVDLERVASDLATALGAVMAAAG
jgi:hypothetical protein